MIAFLYNYSRHRTPRRDPLSQWGQSSIHHFPERHRLLKFSLQNEPGTEAFEPFLAARNRIQISTGLINASL